MNVQDVFTPDGYPEHTYIERNQGEFEDSLEFDLSGSGAIVSISGPSKSGKSMLLNNVVDKAGYDLVTVHGSEIESIGSLWDQTLDELRAPATITTSEGTQDETEKDGRAGVNLPGINAGAGGRKREQDSTVEEQSRGRRGLKQITELVDLTQLVLYIDDAHYIDKTEHREIAEGLKNAFEKGMKICVAFIPYRSDDLTRANPDLSGRISAIELDWWEDGDLEKIGEIGFDILNRHPSDLVLKNLARESVGSPHLMQKLCLDLCKELDLTESAEEMSPLGAGPDDLENVLRSTAMNFYQGYGTIIELLNGDVSEGGNGRNMYDFKIKGEGDIYDVILRAIAANPPRLSLSRNDIIGRIEQVCRDETPHSGNVVQTIQRIDKWVTEKVPNQDYCFDWIDDRNTLEIPDPYLIFCLRWSDINDVQPKLH